MVSTATTGRESTSVVIVVVVRATTALVNGRGIGGGARGGGSRVSIGKGIGAVAVVRVPSVPIHFGDRRNFET